MSQRRRTSAALLTCDIVDSTALVTSLSDERAARVFERFDRVARDLLVQHDGREIDRTDGFLHLFERTPDAVRYAEALHVAMEQLSEELGVNLAVRAGIHYGEMLLRDNPAEDVERGAKPLEVEGLAKPVAARLMARGGGGQTLISDPAMHMARRALTDDESADWQWTRHGEYELKGLEEPLAIWEVGDAQRAPNVAPVGAVTAAAAPTQRALWPVALVGLALLALAAWWLGSRHAAAAFGDAPIAFEEEQTQRLFEQTFEAWSDADATRAMQLWKELDALDPSSPTHWLLGILIARDQADSGVDVGLVAQELPRRALQADHPHARALLTYVSTYTTGMSSSEREDHVQRELPPADQDVLVESLRAVVSLPAAERLVRRLPDVPRTHLALASHLQDEDPRKLEASRSAIRLNPSSPQAHVQLIDDLRDVESWDELREQLPRSLSVAPFSLLRVTAAELALRDGDLEAFEEHRVILMADGRPIQDRATDGRRLARLLHGAGRPRDALVQVRATSRMVEAEDDVAELYSCAREGADLSRRQHDLDGARQYRELARGLVAHPQLPDLLRTFAPVQLLRDDLTVAMYSEDEDAMRQALATIARLDPDRSAWPGLEDFQRWHSAYGLALDGDLDAALAIWGDETKPCLSRFNAARKLVRLRLLEAAAEEYADALDGQDCADVPDDYAAEGLAVLARQAWIDGDAAAARERAREAIELLPLAEPDYYFIAWAREVLTATEP